MLSAGRLRVALNAERTTRSLQGTWNSIENQRARFDEVGRHLRVITLDQWYNIRVAEVRTNGAAGILDRYGDSLSFALSTIYNDYDWIPSNFRHAPHGYWDSVENQRIRMEEIGQTLGVKIYNDWCYITAKQIAKFSTVLVNMYNGSVYKLVQSLYSKHTWHEHDFNVLLDDQARLNELGYKYGISTLYDWYKVSYQDVINDGGRSILKKYESLAQALKSSYPNYEWDTWRFTRDYKRSHTKPRKAPKEPVFIIPTNRKVLSPKRLSLLSKFNFIATRLGIKDIEGWYKATCKDLHKFGCRNITLQHGMDMSRIMSYAYPHYKWQEWKFRKNDIAPSGYWQNYNNQAKFLRKVEGFLDISDPTQWYRVSKADFHRFGASGLSAYFPEILGNHFPSVPWNFKTFKTITTKTKQRDLLSCAKHLVTVELNT